MRINFYDTRIIDGGRVTLVKEKGVNYNADHMKTPKEIVLMAHKLLHLDEMAEEYVYMIAMDNACHPIGVFFVSKGTVSASLINPREIFIRALACGAVHIVLCHNHPFGNVSPSEADTEATQRIKESGKLLGIPLTDHIVIGGSGSNAYVSFKEAGLL